MYECNDHKFSEFQFGFVTGRGSNSAVALVHDVASYFNAKGSTIFMCGLDVEGAFNGVPHPVLFDRARNVITDKSWKLLHNWYVNISVQVRWNRLGKNINVLKGTRQGGLTCTSLLLQRFD